jgi:hypothetical protein
VTIIEHISEKEWSAYTKADYTLEQWHAACLIHLHDGPPTSKNQCKLPVKTPNGAINRNGVHSALAALHGARAELNAPPDQKAKAERQLRSLYSQLDEKFPVSQDSMNNVLEFIEHHGVKGMQWGVRRDRRSGVTVGTRKGKRATERTVFNKPPVKLTSSELEKRIKRMETEKKYNDLNAKDISKGEKLAHEIVTNVGRAVVTTVATGALLFAVRTAVNKKMGFTPDPKNKLDIGALITKRGK